MRLFILAASLSLFLLAACDSTSFEVPRLDLGPTAPKEYRLDLDSGIVVTFDKGPSPEAQGKVAYVTHVPSGSQMMIGRAGQVISRHDGRGGDPERLDEILADKAIMVRIIAGANADDLPFLQHADWINFVKFDGITYIANRGRGKLGLDWLGKERYRIAFELRDFAGGGYRSRDGDAAYLDPGTSIYEVTGYSPRFRLAAVSDGTVTVFEADTSPAARTGADLLDIRGKVRSIGINSPENGITELAFIEDPGMVESLVKIVLSAPVDQGRRDHDGQRYFIAFDMEDGTEVRRACWLESGELHRGIVTDPLFRDSVSQALKRRRRRLPRQTRRQPRYARSGN